MKFETKLPTLKSMKEDGWKLTHINGVKCLKLVSDDCTFVGEWNKSGYMSPTNMLSIVSKLGQPKRIHTMNNSVTTLEY
jgi:hypothetical protein